jgi:hypothetical protein
VSSLARLQDRRCYVPAHSICWDYHPGSTIVGKATVHTSLVLNRCPESMLFLRLQSNMATRNLLGVKDCMPLHLMIRVEITAAMVVAPGLLKKSSSIHLLSGTRGGVQQVVLSGGIVVLMHRVAVALFRSLTASAAILLLCFANGQSHQDLQPQ